MDSGSVDYARFTSDHRIHRSFFLAGFSVLAYDYLLTLPAEAKYIWKSKLRPSTLWFLLLRYTCLISSIWMYTFYFAVFDYESCVKMNILWQVLVVLQEFLIESTLIVRVFAMYGRNPWILVALGAQALLVLAIALWGNIKNGRPQILTSPGPGIPGCHFAISRTTAIRACLYKSELPKHLYVPVCDVQTGIAGAWAGIIACDVVIFLLTLWKAYTQRRSNSALMYRSTTLVERMWRDGAMYFGMIVLMNTANLLTYYFGDNLLAGFLSWPALSLAITLLSRLILNLHEAWHIGIETEEPNTMNLETLRFRTVTRAIDSMNY